GLLPILLSFIIYFWVGMISTRTVTVQCPNCEKYTKILGHVDFCQHCKEPLTIDKALEGQDFSLDYNVEHRRNQAIDEINKEAGHQWRLQGQLEKRPCRLLFLFYGRILFSWSVSCLSEKVRIFPGRGGLHHTPSQNRQAVPLLRVPGNGSL